MLLILPILDGYLLVTAVQISVKDKLTLITTGRNG